MTRRPFRVPSGRPAPDNARFDRCPKGCRPCRCPQMPRRQAGSRSQPPLPLPVSHASADPRHSGRLGLIVALAVPFLLLGISTASPPGAGGDDEALVAATEIPEVARLAYLRASAEARQLVPGCTLPASVLADIYAVTSNHCDGRLNGSGTAEPPLVGLPGESTPRVGPGGFTLGDWLSSRLDGNDDGVADPENIYDSALTTAVVLCRKGAGVDPGGEDGLRRVSSLPG